jgi:nicotinamide-nucleotide amidase
MIAEIITIGDEILIGQVVDTNSAWLAEKLNLIGIKVKQISSVSDDESHIISALDEAMKRADIIFITGGLGPTNDDITKHTLCKYFNTKLIFHQEIYEHIENLFKGRNFPMIPSNRQQADLPENCTIVHNRIGTAPGMWFTKNSKHVISMPGVPFEMKTIVEEELIPKIQSKFELPIIIHRTILTYGIGESFLAQKIENWENELPSNIKLAYLPSPEHMRLRMSITGNNKKELELVLARQEEKLKKIIDAHIFGYENQSLPEIIGELLKTERKTISTAESCTGGNIARLITSIAGSSEYFKGSVVAYSNQIKESILKVNPDDLKQQGAVSETVVMQMAKNVRELFQTDYAIATSGIAGPAGGTTDKPVGTVWIAIATENSVTANKYMFGSQRDINITRTSIMALFNLRNTISDKL